ncbi:aldose epimerase family protein [Cyclobacterium sp. 1_MG-2023]|uniref:aldose epimerase family protein n=1 Tax=Cyclobacterium sp. 1_MG-2023 TaxID=3062681 RepID=UPI0026E3EDF6|nr:aldose epimerase family protein [Cyclobacterium sp. 1_MG-2023]MDO6435802.1 aldose epimerase family protein [Cyclobacterium sp. 1_MG-2023]
MKNLTLKALFIAGLLTACGQNNKEQAVTEQQTEPKYLTAMEDSAFEKTIDGKEVKLYHLTNKNGMEMTVTNFGARVVELFTPDKNGNFEDVVLGYDDLDEYSINPGGYYGAPIGRYGNRIANAQFTLDGKTYSLEANNGPNNLHGAPEGYHKVVWEVLEATDQKLEMKYVSPDGEAGFPGELTVFMNYYLTDDNEFKITYKATTDKPTIVNLTHHSFFNLNGHGEGSVRNHKLQLNADNFTPVDDNLIPLGEIRSVKGTPFDFSEPHLVGERIDADNEQLKKGGGYDHNWVVNREEGNTETIKIASVWVPENGRKMEVYTDQPGVQVYTGNFMTGGGPSKAGKDYGKQGAICLETQHYPDSPNQPSFPSVTLRPEETYSHECIYKFSVID